MAKNRYAKDYRLTEHFEAGGKIRTTYEYIGEDWRFREEPAVVEKEKKKALLRAAAGWLGFVTAMVPQSGAMHFLLIALPFAFCALPLAAFTDSAFAFRRMKEPLEHRHADRLNNRYPPVCLLWILFSGSAGIGQAVRMASGGEILAGDIVFSLCTVFLFLLGIRSFSAGKKIGAEKTSVT